MPNAAGLGWRHPDLAGPFRANEKAASVTNTDGLGGVSLFCSTGGGGVLLLRRCALLREVAPPETDAEKGTNLLCGNAPKSHSPLYRICPYGVAPRLKPCLNRDAHSIRRVGRFQFFEQQHSVHLNGLLAQ